MDAPQALHPSEHTLRAYGLGKLDDTAVESVNKHVESCSDCRRRIAELSSDSFLGRLRDAQRSPEPSPTGRPQVGGTIADRGPPAASSPPPAGTLPPELVDHPDYEIVRELGRGGMGVVYLAHNRLLGRHEVLKLIGGDIIERPGVLDRFLREIRAVARLQHPNIVTAHSAFRSGKSLVFAMEYVEGLIVAGMEKGRGPSPGRIAAHFIPRPARGLHHAKEGGRAHRKKN